LRRRRAFQRWGGCRHWLERCWRLECCWRR
jgi:hypothetical protein